MRLMSVACYTLLRKEIARYMSVYKQTFITPLLSAALYMFIFGYSLGRQISMPVECTYLQFIIPGLVIMGIINNAYQNTASSILTSKRYGNIYDILVAPMSYREIIVAYTLGAVTRAMLVGLGIFGVSLLFTPPLLHSIPITLLMAFLTSLIFGQFGMVAAIVSESYDQLSTVTNFILLPLTYLGGIFYSIKILPPFFQYLSMGNPLFYMVDAFRYGFLGISDIQPLYSIGTCALFCLVLHLICIKLLASGYKLRK